MESHSTHTTQDTDDGALQFERVIMTDQDRDTSKGRGIQHYFSSTDSSSSHNTGVTPPNNNNNRFRGVTMPQDNKKTKAIDI